jgi:hypothetical protein
MALILTPLAVAKQIEREAVRFGYDARVIRDQSEARAGINICNYDRLDKLDTDAFGAVVLDECFAKGTNVDTPSGMKHIEDLREGDYILNCTGVDRISDVHRREVQYAVIVTTQKASFTSSPNHPIFTQRGWVGAQHLRSGDYALATGSAMHLVRGTVRSALPRTVRAEILRDVLFSEMAHDAERDIGARAFAGGCGQTRQGSQCVAKVGQPKGYQRNRQDTKVEPIPEAGSSSEDFSDVARNEAQTVRAWGQWSRDDLSASVDDGCSWERMGSGISVITGPKEGRIPNMLQGRLRQSANENRNRGGWSVALGKEESVRQEAGCDAGFIRVESIDILEPSDSRLEHGIRHIPLKAT